MPILALFDPAFAGVAPANAQGWFCLTFRRPLEWAPKVPIRIHVTAAEIMHFIIEADPAELS